jgi:hypothetical protein
VERASKSVAGRLLLSRIHQQTHPSPLSHLTLYSPICSPTWHCRRPDPSSLWLLQPELCCNRLQARLPSTLKSACRNRTKTLSCRLTAPSTRPALAHPRPPSRTPRRREGSFPKGSHDNYNRPCAISSRTTGLIKLVQCPPCLPPAESGRGCERWQDPIRGGLLERERVNHNPNTPPQRPAPLVVPRGALGPSSRPVRPKSPRRAPLSPPSRQTTPSRRPTTPSSVAAAHVSETKIPTNPP